MVEMLQQGEMHQGDAGRRHAWLAAIPHLLQVQTLPTRAA